MSDALKIRKTASVTEGGGLRWTLERIWNPLLPFCCLIGTNPSVASGEKEDPTTLRINHFIHSWGYGGYILVNLYPVVTPDPAKCKRWVDWENNGPDWSVRDTLRENDNIVVKQAKLASRSGGLVVPCWGNSIWDEFHMDNLVEEIMTGVEPRPDLYCFGTTKNGNPKHPLARGNHRVPDDQNPILWRT